MPETAKETSRKSALTFAGMVMNAMVMFDDGVNRASTANSAGMTAATIRAFTGVLKRGDTRARVPLAGSARSRLYE